MQICHDEPESRVMDIAHVYPVAGSYKTPMSVPCLFPPLAVLREVESVYDEQDVESMPDKP